jgi:hypothetical protein
LGVTLQISLAPPDLPHATHVLPHQLRTWATQVDELLFTLDPIRPAGGRFAANWDALVPGIEQLLSRLTAEYSAARVGIVERSPRAMAAVAQRFFGLDRIPLKDSRGGPLYSYFYGLHDARNELVLHIDSDVLFGGGSRTWVDEARGLLDDHEDALFVGPLPGPPRPDGQLIGQPYATPEPRTTHDRPSTPAFRFPTMSTRIFMVDLTRLSERVGALPLQPPLLLRSRLKARVKGNPSVAMPEQILTTALQRHGLARVDFLGREPGMWSLHPPFRSPAFYRELPDLIARVESGDVPDEQRGHYDVVDALFDFSEVRARLHRSPLRR